jgi:hypothetical protein
MDGNLLELARGLDSEVVGEGSGDDPGCEVAPPSDAAERVAHERPRVPQRPVPSPRRRHLPAPQPQLRARPTGRPPSRLRVWYGGPQERKVAARERGNKPPDGLVGPCASQANISLFVFVCASEGEICRGFFPVKSNSFLRFFCVILVKFPRCKEVRI